MSSVCVSLTGSPGPPGTPSRPGPRAAEERELVHGFALDVGPRGSRSRRLLRGKRDTQRGEDGCSEQALAYRPICLGGVICDFHRSLLLSRGVLSGLHCIRSVSMKNTLKYRVLFVKRIFCR